MYTFCSFYQEVNIWWKNKVYLTNFEDNVPICLASSNWDIIKSLSALAKAIRASSSKLRDWITSSVVRELPESYSSVIPSFAISAAFNWARVAAITLLDDWYLDHELEVSVETLFLVSCKISWDRCLLNDDFFIEETFSPPFIIGQVIVAFTVSSSFSSIVVLKSLFSDLETLIEAEGESLALSIFNSLVEIS